MRISSRNLALLIAAPMALVLGASVAVAAPAAPGDDGPLAGPGQSREQLRSRDGGQRPIARRGSRARGGWRGDRGIRRPLRPGIVDGLIRTETILDMGDAGIVTRRTEQGQVASVGDGSLELQLANGETSQVAVSDGTMVLSVDTSGPRRRLRARIMRGAIDDIAAGDRVIASSSSVDGGPFEASRIVVLGSSDAADGTDSSSSDGEADSSAPSDESAGLDVLSA